MKRAAVIVAAGLVIGLGLSACRTAPAPIRVGVLHSLSGTMAVSARPVAEATLMAIDELNAAGGVLGRPLEAVLRDGASDPAVFARDAESLITAERVAVTFGCWTSSGRRQVTPIVEAHQHLLFYPVQYEGLECSPFIVDTGATPNQSIVPAVTWALDTLGRRVFLVGSDYVFPHTANAIIRHVTASMGGEVVGEAYAPLGSRDFGTIAASISTARPDVILNTINGDGNAAFFRALRQVGITSARIPTVSFSFAEPTIAAIGATDVVGDYSAWSYFQSLDSPENRRFIAGMRRRFWARPRPCRIRWRRRTSRCTSGRGRRRKPAARRAPRCSRRSAIRASPRRRASSTSTQSRTTRGRPPASAASAPTVSSTSSGSRIGRLARIQWQPTVFPG